MKSWKQTVKFFNKESMGTSYTFSSSSLMWIPYLHIKEYKNFIYRHFMLHLKEHLIIYLFSGVTLESLNILFCGTTLLNSLNMLD